MRSNPFTFVGRSAVDPFNYRRLAGLAASQTWQVVAQGRSAGARKAMLHAAKALAATALDLITSAELLARAKIDWSEKMDGQQHACPIPESVQPQAR